MNKQPLYRPEEKEDTAGTNHQSGVEVETEKWSFSSAWQLNMVCPHVFPGGLSRKKRSSLVMPCSTAPGTWVEKRPNTLNRTYWPVETDSHQDSAVFLRQPAPHTELSAPSGRRKHRFANKRSQCIGQPMCACMIAALSLSVKSGYWIYVTLDTLHFILDNLFCVWDYC